jgi:hypothetical protein
MKNKNERKNNLSGATRYYLMKRCLQCFHICEIQNKRCTQCNYLFIGEATKEEKDQANKKLIKLQELKEKDKEDKDETSS